MTTALPVSGRVRRRLALVVAGLGLALLLAEAALRLLTVTAEDGRLRIGRTKLVPFERLSAENRALALSLPADSYIAPDPVLGWTIRPASRDRITGLYASNALGLRSAPREEPADPPPGVLRVLVAGDSFAHGDEVPWAATWTALLEERLGPPFTVLNGGVPGYGTDQAWLRFSALAPRLRPVVGILTILLEDLWRTVNVFRPLAHPWTDLPFSKPRFVIRSGDLVNVNDPVVPVEAVPGSLDAFRDHPLRPYETWDIPGFFQEDPLDASRLWRFLRSRRAWIRRDHLQKRLLGRDSEAVAITERIAARFVADCRTACIAPLLVLIPARTELDAAAAGKATWRPLAEALSRAAGAGFLDLVEPMRQAAPTAGGHAMFYVGGTGHLSETGGRILAALLEGPVRKAAGR